MNNRFIAFYLPQYHPIPENNEFWGPGFTEWTNVAKAKPLFRSHNQPRIPADLGFYDLRVPETREEQAKLAKEAGIEGFCYYHYWFGNGKQLLERPFNEVLESKKPDLPFCLCWANHTWASATWTNAKSKNSGARVIVEQQYPGKEDNERHFYSVLPAFLDPRYITVDGKPFFAIFDPFSFKGIEEFIDQWRNLAEQNGLKGIHFVGIVRTATPTSYLKHSFKENCVAGTVISTRINQVLSMGFDAVASDNHMFAEISAKGIIRTAIHEILAKRLNIKRPYLIKQSTINRYSLSSEDKKENIYPTIYPNWDRTPRAKEDAVYIDSTPGEFEKLAARAIDIVKNKNPEHRIILIKSWNEWGEGNYMEPDTQYGHGYIEALAKVSCK